MFGTILREAAIVFIFCNIFVGGQEFLQYYKPKPGLPKELNSWLANVQKYEKDFRLIRAIAEDPTKFGLNVDEDEEDNNEGDLLQNLEDDYLDYGPKNDIYPHVYKRKNPHQQATPEKLSRIPESSFGHKNNPRHRRHSDSNSFFERRHDIAVNPKSTNGEVKRSDDKYPDRYSNSLDKREIEIDVMNDGKLVKHFRDRDQDPKSIILSFQHPDQEKIPLPPAVAASVENNNKAQLFDRPFKIYTPRSTIDLDNVPAKNKEYSSNFKNLFYANENLNTDSSIARDNLGKTALVYRVTLPDPNFPYQAPAENSPSEKTDSTPASFNNNGFKDMSRFWTMSEKNQLQKGIDFAQDLWDRRTPFSPQPQSLRPADNDGFELVKSLVVDSDSLAHKPKPGGNIPPKIQSPPNVPNKRESETLEGEVDLTGDRKENNCAGGKCSGIVRIGDVADGGTVGRGARFDGDPSVIENEPPATTSIAIIDVESGVETLGNGGKPVEMDHQMPGDQLGDISEKELEIPSGQYVPGSLLENENSGGELSKMDSPEESNKLDDNLSGNNPEETLSGPALSDSVQETPLAPRDPESQNLDSSNLSDISGDHEIDLELSRDVAPTFKENSEKNKDCHHNTPLVRIHKLDQHIDEHIVVTRIESVTVLGQEETNHLFHEKHPTNGEHSPYEEHLMHDEHPVHEEHPEHEEHHIHEEQSVDGEHPEFEDHHANEGSSMDEEHHLHEEDHLVNEEHHAHEEHPVHEDHLMNEEHHVHEEPSVHGEHSIHEEHPDHEDHPEEPVHPLHLHCQVKHPELEESPLHGEEQVHEGHPVHGDHLMNEEHHSHEEHPVHEDHLMDEEHHVHEEPSVHGEHSIHDEHPDHEDHPMNEAPREHVEVSMNEEHLVHEEEPVHPQHLHCQVKHPELGESPLHGEEQVHEGDRVDGDHLMNKEHHSHKEHPVHEDHLMNEEHHVHEEHPVHEDHPMNEEHHAHEENPVHEDHLMEEEQHVHGEHSIHKEHPDHEDHPMNEAPREHEEVSMNEEHPVHEEEPVHPQHLQCQVKHPELEESPLHGEEQVHEGHPVEHPVHEENHVDRDISVEYMAEGRIDPSSGIKDEEDNCETDTAGGCSHKDHDRQGREEVLNSEGVNRIAVPKQRLQKAVRFVPKASVKQREPSRGNVSPKRKLVPPMKYKIPNEVKSGRFQKYRGKNFPNAVRHCDQGICYENANSLESARNPETFHNLVVERSKTELSHPIVHDRKLRKNIRKKKYQRKKHKGKVRPQTEEMDYGDPEDSPTYSRRQLKSIEYVYDVDLESPKEESSGEISKGTTERSEIVHKNSVEGDYSDEEDSMTSKKKKSSSKLVKKTDNEFANPVPTTTEAEDDDEYEYEIANTNRVEKGSKKDKSNVNKLGLHSKDEKLVGFGRHLHKKITPPKKGEKPALANKNDEKNKKAPVESDLSQNNKFRQPRNLPNQKFLESSEFQQWPQFVRNDQINEENLRRRSINRKAPKKNNFPLASKDYFQKSEPKRSDLEKLADKITMADSGGMITEKSNKDVVDEKITINLYLDDKEKTNGDVTIFPTTSKGLSGGQTNAASIEDECEAETPKVKVTNVCEENENFNRTKVALTTVLSIESDNQGELGNETYPTEEYERLDEILNGHLPLKIFDTIYSHMQKNKKKEGRFVKGMKKPRSKHAFEGLEDVNNEESRKLINAMSNIMSRLQLTTICQTLPSKLLYYLKSVTKVPIEDALTKTKQMEEVEFDEAQNQDNFIFQSNSRSDNLEEKVRVLKDLLMKFNHLPDRCKPRAEPVREYIENHLSMLNHMLTGSGVFVSRPKKTVPESSELDPSHPTLRLSEKGQKEDLVEKQLESLGLGKLHDFKPQFNLDELVEHNKIRAGSFTEKSPKKSKRDYDFKRDVSEKYGKLMSAVERKRSKRRVAETFGRLSLEDFNGVSGRRDSFESPVVYSF